MELFMYSYTCVKFSNFFFVVIFNWGLHRVDFDVITNYFVNYFEKIRKKNFIIKKNRKILENFRKKIGN